MDVRSSIGPSVCLSVRPSAYPLSTFVRPSVSELCLSLGRQSLHGNSVAVMPQHRHGAVADTL